MKLVSPNRCDFWFQTLAVFVFKHTDWLFFKGNYPKLVFHFELKRSILYFILETYVPSSLLVVLSWVSFWISLSSVPARICIGRRQAIFTQRQNSKQKPLNFTLHQSLHDLVIVVMCRCWVSWRCRSSDVYYKIQEAFTLFNQHKCWWCLGAGDWREHLCCLNHSTTKNSGLSGPSVLPLSHTLQQKFSSAEERTAVKEAKRDHKKKVNIQF